MAIVDGLRVVARAPTQSIGCMNCHSRMMEAADEIERLSAELAECKRDALRYRFLRDTDAGADIKRFVMRAGWDEIIDAALAAKEE